MPAPQTPRQRLANKMYEKSEREKKGKPVDVKKQKTKEKLPLSTGWIAVLAFLVLGGGVIEVLRLLGVF